MKNERILILDTETTGLNYDVHKIIEIGIIELKDNILTQKRFHEYINPQQDISLSAQKIHGISNEFLINKPTFCEIAPKFLNFIKDDVIVIHNAAFDINFINKELNNCGLSDISNPITDTIQIAKKEFPGQSVNLDSLCKKLNIINTRQDYHGALLDANLLAKVYLKLTTGKQQNLDLTSEKTLSIGTDISSTHYKENFFTPRENLMLLSDHEKEEHKRFIAKMKKAIGTKFSNYF